jgi:hypothetical protein
MGTTDAGTPYPEATDAVTTYPPVSKAAAQNQVFYQKGSVVLVGDGTNQRPAVAVTFPKPFRAVPGVVAQVKTGVTTSATNVVVWPTSVTTTGCAITGVRGNATDMNVDWLAFGLVVQ